MTKAPKAAKPSAEEKLHKALAELAPFEAELSLLVPAQVWSHVEALCRLHIVNGSKEARDVVAQLALTMRQEALRRFGHDTLETFTLANLLKAPASKWQPKPPRRDALSHINDYPHKPHRLSGDQDTAAEDIRLVWAAFGKFLEIASRGIGGGGGNRSQALAPMDVMGEGTWEHYCETFKPWQFKAARTVVTRRTATGNHLTIAAVVYKVLVEDVYPEELDSQFALVKGTGLRALKAGLNAYNDPTRLDGWGKPPAGASAGAKLGGQDGKTAPAGTPAAPQGPQDPPAAPRQPGLWVAPRPTLAPGQKVKLAPRKAR